MRILGKASRVSAVLIGMVGLVGLMGCSGGAMVCHKQDTYGASAYNPAAFTYVRGRTWTDDYHSYYGGGYYQTSKTYQAECPVSKSKEQNYEGWVPGHWEQQGTNRVWVPGHWER